ncbi:hypothetical protein CF165_11000 [Amycolatopsis vastitatis]|uniref:Uncharacterized protein n=1 Tax=Amycolatopsis vastitatis TaxID=1905142 RepID=A0A229TBI5_9PSEU|nr:hypothetical protein CF165_11000 [Amycolatopsis vastitatis]
MDGDVGQRDEVIVMVAAMLWGCYAHRPTPRADQCIGLEFGATCHAGCTRLEAGSHQGEELQIRQALRACSDVTPTASFPEHAADASRPEHVRRPNKPSALFLPIFEHRRTHCHAEHQLSETGFERGLDVQLDGDRAADDDLLTFAGRGTNAVVRSPGRMRFPVFTELMEILADAEQSVGCSAILR